MTKKDFLELMSFPREWMVWNMYPDELASIQMKEYRKGDEEGSEHTRFGAFLWWISNLGDESQYQLIMKLSYLEADKGMAEHVRSLLNQKLKEMVE